MVEKPTIENNTLDLIITNNPTRNSRLLYILAHKSRFWGSKICPKVGGRLIPVYCLWKCQQTIAVYTLQAVKMVLPVYFLAKFDTS